MWRVGGWTTDDDKLLFYRSGAIGRSAVSQKERDVHMTDVGANVITGIEINAWTNELPGFRFASHDLHLLNPIHSVHEPSLWMIYISAKYVK